MPIDIDRQRAYDGLVSIDIAIDTTEWDMAKKPIALDLAGQLRQAVRMSGCSLNGLAHASGVTQSQLSRFMRAERTLTLTAAGKLCATLGLRLTGPGLNERDESAT
jgi:hypothetical protein